MVKQSSVSEAYELLGLEQVGRARDRRRCLMPSTGGVHGPGPIRVQAGEWRQPTSMPSPKETHSSHSVRIQTRTRGTQKRPHSSSGSARRILCFSHTTLPRNGAIVHAVICTRATTSTTTISTVMTTNSTSTKKTTSPTRRNVSGSLGRWPLCSAAALARHIVRFLFEEVLRGRTGRGYAHASTHIRRPQMNFDDLCDS